MKTNKIAQGSLVKIKRWRVRFTVAIYFALLMTLVAPISPVHAPVLSPTSAEADDLDFKGYARNAAYLRYGWDKTQFKCLDSIWTKESNWNHLADNPISSAFGIAQMLKEDSRNGYEQISNGLRYIEHRYSTPCEAWEFWQRKKWY
jgi:hypothetical protein